MTGLAGTGLIADDLYLLAHDDMTGRPFLQPQALGVGLAAALLAELIIGGAVSMRADHVFPGALVPPSNGLAGYVIGVLLSEAEPHPIGDWLVFLARTAAHDVARRLEHSGYLARVSSRRPWRADRFVPVDADSAFAPMLQVRSALNAARPLTAHAAALTGLTVACGLGFRLDQYQAHGGRTVQEAVAWLGPALRELIAQTRIAVDSSVLSHH